MANQERNQSGRFTSKSDEPRSVRTVRLTDTAWAKLGEIANSRSITRADLLEEWARQTPIPQTDQLTIFSSCSVEPSPSKDVNLQQVEAATAQVLNDPEVTRKGKDRGSVKRALDALLKQLF